MKPNDTQALINQLCRQDFVSFVMGAFDIVSPNDKYIHAPYIELICEYLLACQRREMSRLIINIPPRHMKSLIVNVIYPAWLLGHNPTEAILTATYSLKLLKQHSNNFLRLVKSPWYQTIFPNTIIEREALEYITTTAGGARLSTTVAGQITGAGGNYIIIDDPMNATDADSITIREEVIKWYSFSVASRKNQKDTTIIFIAQILHQYDLVGYLTQQGGWNILKLPAIAEKDEEYKINGKTFTRKKGDVLSPDRFDMKFYDEQKKELGEYGFALQYQQIPAPRGGGEIKAEWFQYYDGILNHNDFTRIICVDPANEEKESNDYTVITTIGLGKDQNIYILDIIRDRYNIYERKEQLFYAHNQYRPTFPVLYEKYGKDADIDSIREEMNQRNYRFPIKAVGGRLSKKDRIRRIINYLEKNRVWIPRQMLKYDKNGTAVDLIKELLGEATMFPNAQHDDILDAIARIFDGFENQTLIFPSQTQANFNRLNVKVR